MNLFLFVFEFAILVSLCLSQKINREYECMHGSYPPSNRPKVPTYKINLNLPPIQRWQEVAKHEKQQIQNLFKVFKTWLLDISSLTKYVINFVDNYFPTLLDTIPYPFADELKGMAIASDVPLGEVVMYNIFYEIFTVCTSIVGYDANGTLYHGRNLDFGIFMGWNQANQSWLIAEILKPSIINLEWYKDGKLLFKSVNFAGYIGLLTAIKPKQFTMTMNERFGLLGGYFGILKWILGNRSGDWMSFLTRQTMENATNFDEALKMLSTTEMLVPAYFILGGNKPDQAAIITRDWNKAVDIWHIKTRNSTWFLVQANDDNWDKPKFYDDRRTPSEYCLKQLEQENFGFSGLFDVLNTKPMRNKLTTYTALMKVSNGDLETYIQYCPGDCPPW